MIIEKNNTFVIGTSNVGGRSIKIIVSRWTYPQSLGALGRVSKGYLVINCNTRLCYLFPEGFLADSYIKEKIGGSEEDYPHIGNLVREAINEIRKWGT